MHGKCVGVLTVRKRKQKQRHHWKFLVNLQYPRHPEYVPDHFRNLINCSVVRNPYVPYIREYPPTSFSVILLTNKQADKQRTRSTGAVHTSAMARVTSAAI